MLAQAESEEFSEFAGMDAGFGDPMFSHITPDEPATQEEEMVRGVALEEVGRVLAEEGGAQDVMNMIEARSDEDLFKVLPEIAAPILMKAYSVAKQAGEADEAATVVFGENGLIQEVVGQLFELAETVGHPGAADQDQYAATLIAVYNKAGEHIDQTGDTAAREQVAELATRMAATNPDGTMNDLDSMKDPKMSAVASGVAQSIHGPAPQPGAGGILA
jgi:hypothetical protein